MTLALNLGSTTHTAGGDYNDTCDFSNSTDNNNYFKGTVHDLITPINQNITFDPLSPKIFGDPPFDVSASASSGLPVTFDSSGDCTNSGSTITLTAEGTCTVIATQGGNSSYNPAAEVDQAFDINAP